MSKATILGIHNGLLCTLVENENKPNAIAFSSVLTQAAIDEANSEDALRVLFDNACRKDDSYEDWKINLAKEMKERDALYPLDDTSYRKEIIEAYNELPKHDRRKIEAVFGVMHHTLPDGKEVSGDYVVPDVVMLRSSIPCASSRWTLKLKPTLIPED